MGNKNTSRSSGEGDQTELLPKTEEDTNQNGKEKDHDRDSRIFIAEHIKKRQCITFSQRQERGGADHGDPLCHCNYRASKHTSDIRENNETYENGMNDGMDTGDTIKTPAWDYKTNTTELPTDAYGVMCFNKDKYSKYVRVAEDTEPEVIWTLLTTHWGLEPPNLLISITGGTMSDVEQKLRVAFQRTIVETASTTRAWIFTGGINAGVSKLVGKAVKKFSDDDTKIALIGIAPWGWVRNKKVLEQISDNPVPYTYDQTSFEDSGPLDFNHTHFLLVDNGTQNQVGVEVKFREELEKFISETDNKNFSRRDIDVSKIDILSDTGQQLQRKILRTSCNEGTLENNKVFEFVNHIVFPYLPDKYHGRFMGCSKYEDLETRYGNKDIPEEELKDNIVKYINEGTRTNKQNKQPPNARQEKRMRTINPLCDSMKHLIRKIKDMDPGDEELLTFTEHVIFPHLGGKDFVIERNGKEAAVFLHEYNDLKNKMENGELFAADMKQGILTLLERLPPKGACTDIPSVLIVIAGGPETLKTVQKAVECGKPVIIFKGTSDAADILAYTCTKEYNIENSEELKTKLASCGWNSNHHLTELEKCAKNKKRLTVFNLDSPDSLNMAILNSIKSIKETIKTDIDKYILQLALIWKRVDLISEEIIIDYETIQIEYLEELMLLALKEDTVDFVKHFLSNRVRLEDFYDKGRMTILYQKALQDPLLLKMLNCRRHSQETKVSNEDNVFNYKDIEDFIETLMSTSGKPRTNEGTSGNPRTNKGTSGNPRTDEGTSGNPRTNDDMNPTQQPAQTLFIWNLLMLRADMAWLFFKKCNNAMATSHIAVILLNRMEKQTEDNALKVKIKDIKTHYLQISEKLLNDCNAKSNDNTHLLLVKELPFMSKTKSCIGLAIKADNKKFLSHAACQTLFDNIWNGQKQEHDNKTHQKCDCNDLTNRLQKGLRFICPPCGKFDLIDLLQKGLRFIGSPCGKFAVNYVMYFSFLVLYSVVLLTRFHPMPNMHPLEMALVVWIATFFCEELRQLAESGKYIKDFWNMLDVATLLLYLPGFILRLIPQQTCPGCFEAAVITFAISLMVFTLRILHMFAAVKILGPKLVMIGRMMYDLLHFIMILMVFITAYGVALQVVMYPNAQLDKYLFLSIFRKAYWQIYGELFLEDLEGDVPDCSNDAMVYNNYTLGIQRCPENTWFGPVLLAFYILITNVLMLNLLIAMFSYTFTTIQEESDQIWKTKRYELIREFAAKPPVPPPFSLPFIVYRMIKRCITGNTNYKTQNPFKKKTNDEELAEWEMKTTEAYFKKIEDSEQESTDGNKWAKKEISYMKQTLHKMNDRLDVLGQIKSTEQQIETVKPSQCAVDTVCRVDGAHVIELEECTESGIPHDISEYPGSVTYNNDDVCIVSGGFYPPQFTIVNVIKKDALVTHNESPYTIPEGIGTLSGVMIRQQVINGRKRELYMFVVMYEDNCYRVCTVSIESNTLTVKARFLIGYDPIQAFRIDYLDGFGVLCAGLSDGDINRLLVFSQDRLEYPPDIYQDTLHHNTVQGCDDVISLLGSKGGATSICVTSQGKFCAGMLGENQVQIFNTDGTYLTTIGRSKKQSAPISAGDVFQPCSIICTRDDHILVVGMQGDIQLFKPVRGRIFDMNSEGGIRDENAWNIVRNKQEGSVSGPDFTLFSTICKGFMVNVEQLHNHRKLRVYPLQTTEPAHPSVNRESYAQTQLQLIKPKKLY